MRKIFKTIGVICCVILIFACLVVFNVYISFGYGGFEGFLAEMRSLPDKQHLETLRNNSINQLTQAQTELSTLNGLSLVEKTYSDMCSKGTHGWKRTDSYAYVCSYRLTYYYGTNRDYKELLLDLEKTLDNSGWQIENRTPKLPTIREAIAQNSGEIYLVKLPYYKKKISDNPIDKNCNVIHCDYLTLAINSFYGDSSYWTKSSHEPTPFGFGIALYQTIYENESKKSPEKIFNQIVASGQKGIMIAISMEYFRN
jgi:hypothetical protein